MYSWILYVPGPRSRWSGRIYERDIIARGKPVVWRWLARAQMRGAFKPLDSTRVGYALLQDDVCIEGYDPPPEEMTVTA